MRAFTISRALRAWIWPRADSRSRRRGPARGRSLSGDDGGRGGRGTDATGGPARPGAPANSPVTARLNVWAPTAGPMTRSRLPAGVTVQVTPYGGSCRQSGRGNRTATQISPCCDSPRSKYSPSVQCPWCWPVWRGTAKRESVEGERILARGNTTGNGAANRCAGLASVGGIRGNRRPGRRTFRVRALGAVGSGRHLDWAGSSHRNFDSGNRESGARAGRLDGPQL